GAEQQQYNELEDMVTTTILAPMSGRLVWSLESSREFTVASVRKLIDDKWLPGADKKTRWIKYVPIKINVHAWEVMSDSIPTRFNISRRGISIDSLSYVLCDNGVETSNHLFFSCCFVRQVFRLIMRWWDVPEAEFESYAGWLDWLVNLRFQLKKKMMFEGVFYVTWWMLWTFRNKIIFEKKTPLKATFFDDVMCHSFFWCRSRCKASFTWNDWLKNPNLMSVYGGIRWLRGLVVVGFSVDGLQSWMNSLVEVNGGVVVEFVGEWSL
nr:RNA-directed DNA polymerase, eukaryota [Tanacetum cinerariifolium]